jgi:hypothetical protein
MRGDHVSSVEVRGTESHSEARSVIARTFETMNESVPSSRVIKGHQGSSGVRARTFETMNESVPTLGGEALLYMPKGELPSRFVVACIA